MQFTTIATAFLSASLALAAPAPGKALNKRFTLEGAPSNDVKCPDCKLKKALPSVPTKLSHSNLP